MKHYRIEVVFDVACALDEMVHLRGSQVLRPCRHLSTTMIGSISPSKIVGHGTVHLRGLSLELGEPQKQDEIRLAPNHYSPWFT